MRVVSAARSPSQRCELRCVGNVYLTWHVCEDYPGDCDCWVRHDECVPDRCYGDIYRQLLLAALDQIACVRTQDLLTTVTNGLDILLLHAVRQAP